jgi:hypothetical protein
LVRDDRRAITAVAVGGPEKGLDLVGVTREGVGD